MKGEQNIKKKSCVFIKFALNIFLEMKNTISFCALTLLLGAVAVAPSFGQDAGTAPNVPNSSAVLQNAGQKRHASPEGVKKRQLSVLRKEAGLTPDQEPKVTPIISKYVDEVWALKNDTSLLSAAKREKRKTLHSQYVTDINAVLNPDQQKNWAAANAARIERLRAARGRAQPSASPAESQ
jgi:hypothetical protein